MTGWRHGAAAAGAFALLGAAAGLVLAAAWINVARHGLGAQIDLWGILRDLPGLWERRPQEFRTAMTITGAVALAGAFFGAVMTSVPLTRYGRTRWQTRRDLARNGFFERPGQGFLLGRIGGRARSRYLSSTRLPHALVVAPTGRGKTSGFVIPNLLTFEGSTVVLDVKGEAFAATSRARLAKKDRVFRFAPIDWEAPTHRYNPLARISELPDGDRQQLELKLLATAFLQADNDRVAGLLQGGIDLFTAAGLLAFERGVPTLGEIYRIAATGGDKRKAYADRAEEVGNDAARLIFERLASTNVDTLTSYLSLLMTSGLDQWANPAIDAATAASDFDFRDLRRRPISIYLVVPPMRVPALAPLIRLFFSDLLNALQEAEPGEDEPWPVMIILDEFNRLGKMPVVASSIETLRSYGGRLAVITQTIPALDELYGENTRKALQGNAGVKLYLTPSDEKTVEELVRSVGKTTVTAVTRSRPLGPAPMRNRSVSERAEERDLLPADEARRMALTDVVLVVDAQMPVRAKRLAWFEDSWLRGLHDAQEGPLPMPDIAIQRSPPARPRAPEAQEDEQPAPRPVIPAPARKRQRRQVADSDSTGAPSSLAREIVAAPAPATEDTAQAIESGILTITGLLDSTKD